MIRTNLHTHTTYGDGANTLEEMVDAAWALGYESIGISEHAYAPYDLACCIRQEEVEPYRRELAAMKERYAGKMEVYAGLEVDAFCLHNKGEWDYVIASVHQYQKGGRYFTLDDTGEKFDQAVEAAGGLRQLAEGYVASLVTLAEEYRPDILGHLDILTKCVRRGERALDTSGTWYRDLWEDAAGRIAATGCMVEANLAGMIRGYSSEPFPSREILGMLCRRGVPVTLSADAHSVHHLGKCLEEGAQILREVGYRSILVLRGGRFVEEAL